MTTSILSPAEPYSAEFCEREYNVRVAVPNHNDFLVRWASRSAIVRDKISCYPDFPYGKHAKQALDLFPVANPRGLLVFIHGGYWRTLDKSDFSFVAEPFVAREISVAIVNYTLCPLVHIDDIVRECASAVAWLHHQTRRFGLDGKPMVIAGHSAGGHLAAMMLTLDWAALGVPPGRFAGAAAVSGLFDLEPLLHTSMNADIRLDSASVQRLSPVRIAPALPVPLRLVVGGAESGEFLRQSRLIEAAWPRRASAPEVVPDRHHFSIVDHFVDPASQAFHGTLALFG